MASEIWYVIAVLVLLIAIGFVVVGSPANNAAMQANVAPPKLWACPDCGTENALTIQACECGYIHNRIQTSQAALQSGRGEGWRLSGWTILACGVIGLAVSLLMSTSVPASGLYGDQSEIINLGLIFNKGVAVACSLSAIGLGVFCFAVGAIIKAIQTGADSR